MIDNSEVRSDMNKMADRHCSEGKVVAYALVSLYDDGDGAISHKINRDYGPFVEMALIGQVENLMLSFRQALINRGVAS